MVEVFLPLASLSPICSLRSKQPSPESLRRNQYQIERNDVPCLIFPLSCTTDDASTLLYMPDSTPLVLLLLWASDKAIDVYHHGCFWLCGQAYRIPALAAAKNI